MLMLYFVFHVCSLKRAGHPAHMDSSVRLAVLGRQNNSMQLDDGHRLAVRKHNEEVDKNSRFI